jgi:hypothetical protein
VAWQGPAAPPPSLGPANDDPLSWTPGHTRWLKGATDLGEVREDVARSDGEQHVWRARGVGVGQVEERVQEGALMLLYEQAAAAFPVWRKEKRS